MKTLIINTILQFSFTAIVLADGLRLPATDPLIAESINKAPSEETRDPELEAVPSGTIKSAYISEIQSVKALIAGELAKAPEGQEGKSSQWYSTISDLDSGLDSVLKTRSCAELFLLIPKLASVFQRLESDEEPEFFVESISRLDSLGRALLSGSAQIITAQGGNVDNAQLVKLVTLFCVLGFHGESDWEDEVMPIDAAGVFILDPVSTVTYLKTLPWQQADLFLSGKDSASAFKRYATDGDGLAVLRSRYGANQAVIVAKWNELTSWVEQQSPPEQ